MTDLKETAKRVFLRTLNAIEPRAVINQRVRLDREILSFGNDQIPLDGFSEVVLIGIGKASLKMGAAVEDILGLRVKRGILVTDRRTSTSVRSEVVVGGHPLPDANSLKAGGRIVELVRSCDDRSLIIFLISGGGSALVEDPASESISLEDLRITNQLLIGCGATIREINLVRKRLSRIKGGGLGWLARNSTCVGLYISDVNSGDLRSVASNPLLPEQIRGKEPRDVVARFNLKDKLPGPVIDVLEQGRQKHPFSAGRGARGRPLTMLLLDNSNAVLAAAEQATEFGFRVEVGTDLIEGEYRTVADQLIDRLLKLRSLFPNERICVISGGEVSCSVLRDGIQEFVLYSAARLGSLGIREGAVVLSCGTDGIDGNSNAAGAVADADLVIKAARHAIDAAFFIGGNDSHSFFRKTGGLVVTGPTGNNVRDLRLLMAQ